MHTSRGDNSRLDRVILLFLLALFLLLSPVRDWWAADERSWFAPYLLWLGLIVLGYLLQRVLERGRE